VRLDWRGELTDEELVDLTVSHGGSARAGWWNEIRTHSFGWVTARTEDGLLVGFVNVVSDGADHAVEHARAAGHEWLHVDFDPHLRAFYFDACGFVPTDAGLINLR
jgi:hypothetical protein